MFCPSIYSLSWSGFKKGHYQSFAPVCLNEAGIPTIISHCKDICDKAFNAALGNKDNKLNKLLTEANKAPYLLRKKYLLNTSKVEHGPF